MDTLTASEAEMINRADEDHLTAALAAGRVLYSYNLKDFCILHQARVSQGISHAGIIVAPQQRYTLVEELSRAPRILRVSWLLQPHEAEHYDFS